MRSAINYHQVRELTIWPWDQVSIIFMSVVEWSIWKQKQNSFGFNISQKRKYVGSFNPFKQHFMESNCWLPSTTWVALYFNWQFSDLSLDQVSILCMFSNGQFENKRFSFGFNISPKREYVGSLVCLNSILCNQMVGYQAQHE